MNIILMNHFPLHGSGSGTYTFNIAQTLAKMGHKVTVIFPENKKIDFEIPNVKLHPVYFRSENNADFLTDCLPFNFPCFTTHPGSTLLFSDLTEEQSKKLIKVYKEIVED